MSGPVDRQLTCLNGHTFTVNDPATSDAGTRCPECGVAVSVSDIQSPTGLARSLWEVMGQGSGVSVSETETDSDDAAITGSDDESSSSSETHESEPVEQSQRPRGLWAMMGTSPLEAEAATGQTQADDTDFESDVSGTDGSGAEASESLLESDHLDDEDLPDGLELDDEFELADDDEDDGWEVDSPLHDLDAAEMSSSSEASATRAASRSLLLRGSAAVAAGVLSIVLSGLNLLPSFVARFPATIVGAYALLLGYQTMGSNRRLRESAPKYLAPAGMILGLIGIFAGPLYLVELGESRRNRSSREVIETNLGRINEALLEYASEQGHFPAGGTFSDDENGDEVGMHGWMTSLLPYLGHSPLYSEINLSKPWNDDVNFVPMSQPVSTFLVPSVPHEPTGRGFATTHFAGVGGVIQTEQGLLPTGIFEKNSTVKLQDVTDGMSQTLIAGEIARALPAWGSPENWRTVEGPLNRRLSSFGNADGTGAHFLHGDGSVRFFSNRMDPEVMQKLATRNAGD